MAKQPTYRYTEVAIHVAFWLLLFSFSMNMTGKLLSTAQAMLESSKMIVLLMIAAYTNIFYIIPTFFRPGKFGWYGLSIFSLLFCLLSIHLLLPDLMEKAIIEYMGIIEAPLPIAFPKDRFRAIPVFFMLIAVLFVSTVYKLSNEFLQRDRQTLQLEQERVAYELSFLKSQINPHFLFNALNNLGATAYLYPERTEGFIQKLADMLRYMLEDGQQPKVSLSKEIVYLENYLWFQRQKGQELGQITLTKQGENPEEAFIAPMLLIILVENAFIHGYQEDDERQRVDINLAWDQHQLRFDIKNTIPQTISGTNRRSNGGLGLVNLRRRLALLYPEAFSLSTQKRGDFFQAHLQLNLKPNKS